MPRIAIILIAAALVPGCGRAVPLQQQIDAAAESGRKTVEISGVHYIQTPIRLTQKHSGLSIVGKGAASILGAKKLSNLREENGLWVAELDRPFVDFIFVNGARAECAAGEFKKIARLPGGDSKMWNTLIVNSSDLPDISGDEAANAALDIIVNWQQHRYRIARVEKNPDAKTSTVHFNIPNGMFRHMLGHNVFRAVNLRRLMKEGTFVFDFASKTLRYKPRPGEALSTAEVLVPAVSRIFEISGGAGGVAENISLKNLRLSYCARASKDFSIFSTQAACELNGAVYAENARNLRVENCAFSNLDTYALEFERNVRGIAVERCLISDVAGGGVKVGMPKARGAGLAEADIVSGAAIRDNVICRYGRGFWAACGVLIFDCPQNEVSHNTIFDGYYSGVSCGWTWDPEKPTYARDNRIADNKIYKIGQGMMSDLGGVYTLGSQPNSRIEGNVISQVLSRAYGGNGIYCDESSAGITVENNYISDCGSGINLHIPGALVVRNNVVCGVRNHAFCIWMTHSYYRADLLGGSVITNNIFAFSKDAQICLRMNKDQRKPIKQMDYNAYYNPDRSDVISFNEKSKTKQRDFDFLRKDIRGHFEITGRDEHSVSENPDLENGVPRNAKLCEKIGFKPFRTDLAGARFQLK